MVENCGLTKHRGEGAVVAMLLNRLNQGSSVVYADLVPAQLLTTQRSQHSNWIALEHKSRCWVAYQCALDVKSTFR